MLAKNVPTSTLQAIFRWVLGAFMVLAGIGHLTFQRETFQAQVPPWLPLDADFVVLASGVVEIALGLFLIVLVQYEVWVGLALAIFFVLVFPGNVAQYVEQRDAFGLDTDRARLIRLFFQPILILWALWCSGALSAWADARRSSS